MAKTVETYRVLKDGLRVGDSVRPVGSLIPEASDWPNTDVYERNGYIQRIWLTEEELAEEMKSLGITKKKQETATKKRAKKAVKKAVKVKKKPTEKKESDAGQPELSEQQV